MRNFNNVSLGRAILALAVTLLVGGSGMALAAGPDPTYVPKSSVLIGPVTVNKNTTANYVLRVTFTNNSTADFPPTMGANFTAVFGAITPTSNSGTVTYTATTTQAKDRVTGTFAQNGAQVTSSLTINTP